MWPLRKKRSRGIGLPREKLVPGESLTEWVPRLDGTPTPPRPRRLSPIEQQHLREQTKAWITDGIIEQCDTIIWTNNPVFVAKKNGTIRTCIDCTPANSVTEDFDWPLPRLMDLRHATSGARWFSRMDMKDAFFRIRIPKEWRHLTAFESNGIRYQFKRMPFGLKTAPAVFQRFMDHTLGLFHYCFTYMDDVLIYADSLAELRRMTRRVKQALREKGMSVNEDKSSYEQKGLLFAGIWVYGGGTGPNLSKVKEVLALPTPRTKTELRSALGLVSYLRDHIPLASMLTARLHGTEIPKEDLEKEWARLLRHIQRTITTLAPWNESRPAELYTDASKTAIGAVLIQDGRIIALASRKLNPAETRYSTTDREHLSLALAAKKMRVFLHRRGAQTKVWNDHQALLGRNAAEMTPRQARTYLLVREWIPTLLHVKGESNPADYVSRWTVEIDGGQISSI